VSEAGERVGKAAADFAALVATTSRAGEALQAEVLQVPALVHGRVLLELPAGGEPTALLVGFHGYAQRGEDALDFLRPLAAVAEGSTPRNWALAAPQALHPFYRKDGTVVSGWMTKLDRELALADNVAYAARAVGELLRRLPSVRRLAMVGFSQGVAMTYRAAARCGHAVDVVVALAGDVPPELRDGGWGSRPHVLIGRGSREEWYGEDKLAADREALTRLGLEHEVCAFEGGHEWGQDFVARARDVLAERLAG
jgi:predicted esterase